MPQFVQTDEQKELIRTFVMQLGVYRRKAHLSQGELAAAIGKSRQKVSEIERGAAPMGWDTYLAMLMVFHAYGALDPRGRDSDRLIDTGRVIGARLML